MLAWSVQIIIRLDSQSKLQMFTLFSGRYVGVPRRSTNKAAPYCVLYILTYISSVRERTDLKHKKESSLLIIFFLLYAMNGFRIIFSLRDNATQEYGILVHGVLCLLKAGFH